MIKKQPIFGTNINIETIDDEYLLFLLFIAFENDKILYEYQFNYLKSFINDIAKLLNVSNGQLLSKFKSLLQRPVKTDLFTISSTGTLRIKKDFDKKVYFQLVKKLYSIYDKKFLKLFYQNSKYDDIKVKFALLTRDEKAFKDILLNVSYLHLFRNIYEEDDLSFIKDAETKKILSILLNQAIVAYDLPWEYVLKYLKLGIHIEEKIIYECLLMAFLELEIGYLHDFYESLKEQLEIKYFINGLINFFNCNEKRAAKEFAEFVKKINKTYLNNKFPWYSIYLAILIPLLYRNGFREEFEFLKNFLFPLANKNEKAKFIKQLIFEKKTDVILSFDEGITTEISLYFYYLVLAKKFKEKKITWIFKRNSIF